VTDPPELQADAAPRDLAGWVDRHNAELDDLGRLAGKLKHEPAPLEAGAMEENRPPEHGQTPQEWANEYAIRRAADDRQTAT
jgi:hypothetical protein